MIQILYDSFILSPESDTESVGKLKQSGQFATSPLTEDSNCDNVVIWGDA